MAIGYPYGSIIQLLILTGQRRGEIASLRRSWIEGDLIATPTGFTKHKREHRLPLSPMAQQVIGDPPEQDDLLFPARGVEARPFNGWGKSKERFDKTLQVSPYTLHDLRRTFSSNLARNGTPIHVTEKLLNHVSGTLSGVAAVYNRYSYLTEMRDAVRQHDAFLEALITGGHPSAAARQLRHR
jgi:integrase